MQRLDRPTEPVTPAAPQKSDFHTEGVGCGCGEGLHPYIYMYKKTKNNIKIYVGLDQNSFFQEWPFLAKKNTLAKLLPCPQKTFVGPYVGLYVGIFGRKHGLDRGHLSV